MTCSVCENDRSGGLEVHQSMSYRPFILRLFFYGGLGLLFFITTQIRFVSYLTRVFMSSPVTANEVFRDLFRQDRIFEAGIWSICGMVVGSLFGWLAITSKARRLKRSNDNSKE